jgi:hypothetical protein
MAKKVMLLKLLQEMRGYQQVTNRRPVPATPLLYLMQLRQRNTHVHARTVAPSQPQRLAITTDWQNIGETPAAIKIHHLDPKSDMPVVIG